MLRLCVMTMVFVPLCKGVDLFGPKADTEHGAVEGSTNLWRTVDSFLGIPFADPPIGDNRFRPPQPFSKPWSPKTRQAKKLGEICAQLEWMEGHYAGSEDCLYLNVYRPHGAGKGSRIPVIIYIYGGGFVMGDNRHLAYGKIDIYNPTNIVQKHGHVFVSMNYRLGGFGFWALPELASEQKSGTTGNYGLLDQRAAMQWVQRNVQSFGGDPNQVTIQGESAGAFSVTWHLVSPGSKGFFHGAIAESATDHKGCFFQNKTDSFRFYTEMASQHGCNASSDRIACLRKLPTKDLMVPIVQWVKDWTARLRHKELPEDIPQWTCPLWPLNAYGAVVDGSDEGLPEWPEQLLEAGHVNKVPLLMGTNRNEGALFGWALPLLWGDLPFPGTLGPDGNKSFSTLIEWMLRKPSDRAKALELYNSDPAYGRVPGPSAALEKYDRFYRDSFFHCPTREILTQWSKHGMPTHQYVFSFAMHTNISKFIVDFTDAHGFELPFVFRNYVSTLGHLFLEPKRWADMSDVMSCTWASFVKCQKPKCPSLPSLKNCEKALEAVPTWPTFSAPDSRKYMSFKTHSSIEEIKPTAMYEDDEFAPDDRCDFWKTVDWGWQSPRRDPRKESIATVIV